MQSSGYAIKAFFSPFRFSIRKTSKGQTSIQIPQPVHLSVSIFSIIVLAFQILGLLRHKNRVCLDILAVKSQIDRIVHIQPYADIADLTICSG